MNLSRRLSTLEDNWQNQIDVFLEQWALEVFPIWNNLVEECGQDAIEASEPLKNSVSEHLSRAFEHCHDDNDKRVYIGNWIHRAINSNRGESP